MRSAENVREQLKRTMERLNLPMARPPLGWLRKQLFLHAADFFPESPVAVCCNFQTSEVSSDFRDREYYPNIRK